MRHLRLLGAAAALAVVLTGCAAPAPEGAAPPKPTTTATAKPTATPTSTSTASAAPTKPALDDLIVSSSGLGPLVLGAAPPVTDPALDVLVIGSVTCDPGSTPITGVWLANYPDGTTLGGKVTSPFQVAVNDGGAISRIDVRLAGPHTDRGIQIGSTAEEVVAAYPDASEIVDFERALVYAVRGPTGTLLIEMDTRDDGAESGFGKVVSIRVGPPDVPVYAVSNTGNVISPCNLG